MSPCWLQILLGLYCQPRRQKMHFVMAVLLAHHCLKANRYRPAFAIDYGSTIVGTTVVMLVCCSTYIALSANSACLTRVGVLKKLPPSRFVPMGSRRLRSQRYQLHHHHSLMHLAPQCACDLNSTEKIRTGDGATENTVASSL